MLRSSNHLPYPPSWLDRFVQWVRNLPIPAWLFYSILWLVLSGIEIAVKWLDGTFPVGEFSAYHALPQLILVYDLAVMHYFNQPANKALLSARPALSVDERQYEQLQYRLTILPARPALIASLLGMAFGFFVFSTSQSLLPALRIFTSPLASVVEFTIGIVMLYGTWGVLIYHSVRQLRLINYICERYAQVGLFDLAPLYAFSGLAARTSAALAFSALPWLFLVPEAFSGTLGGIVYLAILLLVCGGAFVWPLVGVHNILVEEKTRRQQEQRVRMQAVIADLHERINKGELTDIGTLKTVMDALVVEEGVLEKISTWPWRSTTVSVLAASLLLPVIVWLVTRMLERLGI